MAIVKQLVESFADELSSLSMTTTIFQYHFAPRLKIHQHTFLEICASQRYPQLGA
jgi:hypothetical protein